VHRTCIARGDRDGARLGLLGGGGGGGGIVCVSRRLRA
jgi:hypothetical protein